MALSQKEIESIEKMALQNAIKHNSIPNSKSVVGKVLNLFPFLKNNVNEILYEIDVIIEKMKKSNIECWIKKLKQIDPICLEEIYEKKNPHKGLKDLPYAKNGSVVMRFAPNPNGPPTIGSSRGMIINTEYVKKYNGKFILRYDDTDPDQKKPMLEAYNWYIDDFKWLGINPDQIIYASDRLELYYEFAEKLINLNKAYVCFCNSDTFKELKNNKVPCQHRSQTISENMIYWKNMLEGKYQEKEAVLRIKTDIENKDPALRDWGAFRIIKKIHPRHNNNKYIVWPLLDFEGAIEDHVLGTTHIIRGKDLQDSGKRQKYIYDYLNWEYPVTLHWGRVKIEEFGKLSTSKIKKAIEEKEFTGWDDPKLPTIRSIRRRGIQPEALIKVMIELGVGETDISMSMEALYAENRKLIDPIANRYFFVWEPKIVTINNIEFPIEIKLPRHPNNIKNLRTIKIKENNIYICKTDVQELSVGQKIRLKDLFNIKVKCLDPITFEYIDNSLVNAKEEKMKIIHWVPTNDVIKIDIKTKDDIINGITEIGIINEVDKVIQFERFGFCRIDSFKNEKITAYYTHK